MTTIADYLWGNKASFRLLFLAAIIMLLTFLGGRELWTQEHRWAEILTGMFYRDDFIHPYLGKTIYYDKPLLSYWLMALFAKIGQGLSVWSLRLPSALSGLLAIISIYRLGVVVRNKQLGLLAGWMLITTYYFVFWSRVSSADMLNLAGSLFAVAWYMDKRERAGFWDYAIFFQVIALTSLCKGLIGAIVPLLAVMTDLMLNRSVLKHVKFSLLFAVMPALLVYVFPFWLSSNVNGDTYGVNGLYLVYQENIMRYFQPFDHQGPIYTYFEFLPIYTFPWIIFLLPAICTLPSRWRTLATNSKWVVLTLFVIFAFLTSSGSRRDYYVLPMVPFAILMTADWLYPFVIEQQRLRKLISNMVLGLYCLLISYLCLLPAWYYSSYGVVPFVSELKQTATQYYPWHEWKIVTLDAESKNNFYLGLTPGNMNFHIKGDVREKFTTPEQLLAAFPILKDKPAKTIFVTRKRYEQGLNVLLNDYRQIELPMPSVSWLSHHVDDDTIAYVPIYKNTFANA